MTLVVTHLFYKWLFWKFTPCFITPHIVWFCPPTGSGINDHSLGDDRYRPKRFWFCLMESSISSNDKSLHCLNEEKQLTCNTWSWRLSFEACSGHPRLFVSVTMTHIHYERNSENDRIENPLIDESFLHWQTCTLMTYYDSANCSKRQNNVTSILISLYCELKVTLLSRRGKGNRIVSGGSVIFLLGSGVSEGRMRGWAGGAQAWYFLPPIPRPITTRWCLTSKRVFVFVIFTPNPRNGHLAMCWSPLPAPTWTLVATTLIGLNISLY